MRRSGISTSMLILIILLFISRIQSGRADLASFFYDILIALPGIVLGLSLHEFGHAFVADRLGDSLPRSQGRVTVNPLAHIDPIGFFCLIFGGFGWGRPVMINPNVYKHPRRDRLLVSFAGVIMNAILVIVLAFVTKWVFSAYLSSAEYSKTMEVVLDILVQAIAINIMLMVFNLLPVPPLDGFNIVTEIFNLRASRWYGKVYQMGGIILLALVLFRLTSVILTPAVQGIYSWVLNGIILS